MPWAQVVFYTALACKSGMSRKLRHSELVPHLTSEMPIRESDFQVDWLGAVDMSDFIQCDFSSVPQVSDVRVQQRGDEFNVEISVTDFDRKVRNKIYAKEKALYREFPSLFFEF